MGFLCSIARDGSVHLSLGKLFQHLFLLKNTYTGSAASHTISDLTTEFIPGGACATMHPPKHNAARVKRREKRDVGSCIVLTLINAPYFRIFFFL